MKVQSIFKAALAACSLAMIAGCPGNQIPGGSIPGAIGSTIATATPLTLDSDGTATIQGTISGSKVDVYDLGPVSPGDHIVVHVRPASGSGLDPTTAMFDTNSELFALNDDTDTATGRVDSTIDDYVRSGTSHLYLATTKYYSGNNGGAYEGDVSIQHAATLPAILPQVLLLNFAGGTIDIPDEGTYSFGPFDSADIDAAYAGATTQIKAVIVATVKQNYQNFGITIVTSDDPPVDNTNCVVSTIQFGAFSATKFGIAQDVDQANHQRCDSAIVFTDQFDKPFSPQPTTEGIGVAIGNVASHEGGHLLGLNHVADVTDLMDTTGSASTLLGDQEFKTSPLVGAIFPFGQQNGPAILDRVIPK
ncbi:MAG TPA: hypothetical protein VMV81_09625 [Phycisphaerae bacterium]|nr:hypothetical protein [Phycisphaerae bacterium]